MIMQGYIFCKILCWGGGGGMAGWGKKMKKKGSKTLKNGVKRRKNASITVQHSTPSRHDLE